jgi:predicted metal-dependent enzyme (double-stranded beta helix superfamily)
MDRVAPQRVPGGDGEVTHQSETFTRVPTHLLLDPLPAGHAGDRDVRLLVRGQGTLGFANPNGGRFTVAAAGPAPGAGELQWTVDAEGVSLRTHQAGQWTNVLFVEGAGLDPESRCEYWFSFDSHNRELIYGKGEMRLGTSLARFPLPAPTKGQPDPYAWLAQIETVQVSATVDGAVDLWRDPVTGDPPLRVVPNDQLTMEDVAKAEVTVAANLTPACQVLYANVAGTAFALDTPDFPDFSRAIEDSINDPAGWCHQTLAAKAEEFGTRDPQKTYLRVTLGRNQGESPGVPFVMEIWPSGHYSPIHNHGGSDAVIKVLHGDISVSLYAMLSPHHQQPFAEATFTKNDVTWISARLNQVHMLQNLKTEPCITIQCYMYAETNLTHYPYFDYLEKADIGHFDPNSDVDFLAFKALMKAEQARRSARASAAGATAAVARPTVLVAERVGIRGLVGAAHPAPRSIHATDPATDRGALVSS